MRKDLLIVVFLAGFFLFGFAGSASARIVGDFNNDAKITTADVVILLAWVQTGRGTDKTVIETQARAILPTLPTTAFITDIPSLTDDDLNDDGKITTSDVVLMLAWVQTGRGSDATVVETQAKAILATVVVPLSKFPGMEIGSATIPIKIEGIQSN